MIFILNMSIFTNETILSFLNEQKESTSPLIEIYSKQVLKIYDTMYDFVYTFRHELIMVVHFLLLLNLLLEKKKFRHVYMHVDKENQYLKTKLAEYKERVELFVNNSEKTTGMMDEMKKMHKMCESVLEKGNEWMNTQQALEHAEFNHLHRKQKEIDEILVDGVYNDCRYLAYDSELWTMKDLKKKAEEMDIPDIYWGNKDAISHVIRLTEQIKKISDIIEPVYPCGYETEPMEEDSGDEDSGDEDEGDEGDENEGNEGDEDEGDETIPKRVRRPPIRFADEWLPGNK